MSLVITYGTLDKSLNVTALALAKCVRQNILYIPSGDLARAALFSDPVPGIVKSIFIIDLSSKMTGTYDISKEIYIDLGTNRVYITNIPEYIKLVYPIDTSQARLDKIRSGLKIEFGSFSEEGPEQLMVARCLTGTEKVLEIGGNIGRNSMVIASILNSCGNSDFVCLESDEVIASQLAYNKDMNDLKFFIESSALSKRRLVQQGWNTYVGPEDGSLPVGHKNVKTLTWEQLTSKYNIAFDTLVLDCEGSFYYNLLDNPEMLDNINLIVMENDYNDLAHKQFVDSVLTANNFKVFYSESGGWGPCQSFFFEVWKKSVV